MNATGSKIQVVASLALALVFPGNACFAQKALRVGDKAPQFSGVSQDGKEWKLADRLGKKLVLVYFYPRDDTPGCTTQACGLRDSMEDLNKGNTEVVGISFDSAESHRKFIEKYNLNFTLLADEQGRIADAFGVRNPEKNIARRVSFLVGRDGRIKHITDSPKADVHLSEMKAAVQKAAGRA